MLNKEDSNNKSLRDKIIEKMEEDKFFIEEEKREECNKKLQLIFA